MARILIVDDEPQIIRFLSISLESQGYEVISAQTGLEGISQAGLAQPELIILDLGLPDRDGQDVLREIRGFTSVPILVLSAREAEQEKVQALDQGANDYIVKPFGVRELLARLRRHLAVAPGAEHSTYQCQGLVIDFKLRRVTLDGQSLQLSRKEYALLKALAEHSGQLLTHNQLRHMIWGRTHNEPHYLRILVGRLRQKLSDDASNPRFIETEMGVGYRLRAPDMI